MKINRTMTIETNEIQIGDRIQVGHYTATCQALPGKGLALFLLDQYLDKAMQMNEKNANKGGYPGERSPRGAQQREDSEGLHRSGAGALRQRRSAPSAVLRRDVRAR
mgnify:CR=1 FL=1